MIDVSIWIIPFIRDLRGGWIEKIDILQKRMKVVKTWNQTKWKISSTRTIFIGDVFWKLIKNCDISDTKMKLISCNINKTHIIILHHQPVRWELWKIMTKMCIQWFTLCLEFFAQSVSQIIVPNGLLLRSASENMTWDNYAPNKINRLGAATTYSIIIMISKLTLTKLSKNMIFKSIICGTILKPILYHTKKQPTPRSAISFIP